jgi:predicted dinucleotide-binding enzyme
MDLKIGVLGTGMVGQTIGAALVQLGYEVKMGSRTSNNEKALALAEKYKDNGASNGTFEEAAGFGEITFNCTKGANTLEALALTVGALKGKLLIDVTNPLDFSNGMPPCLIPELSNSNSLGEEIQKLFPETSVVKTLNTMWCGLMVNPNLIGEGNHINYVCGNNSEGKFLVKGILKQFGWKDENLLDLGDITNARATEAILPIWLRLYGVRKNGVFNFQIVG